MHRTMLKSQIDLDREVATLVATTRSASGAPAA
jgi:hypothetical protein